MEEGTLKYKAVIIGGSAGSLEPVLSIISQLPASARAVFILVLHRRKNNDALLADLLAVKTTRRIKEIEDKECILPGTIYIAPSDYHLLLENQQSFSLDFSEKVHYSRPSIDVTFYSASQAFHESVIGILLSGSNIDGAEGLKAIRHAGGFTIVQDPVSADVAFMPQQAISRQAATRVLPAAEIPAYLNRLLEMVC